MNVLMFTNTYAPHVGGVARSVAGFAEEFRRQGHRVLVVAPTFDGTTDDEPNVLRVPAIEHFRDSDFSLPLPIPVTTHNEIEEFGPNVIHSHHPFLLGHSALRAAALYDLPVVFTHHTQYHKYTHYIAGDWEVWKRLIVDMATGYCNLCDAVIAPSQSIVDFLRDHEVTARIEVIPTGVDFEWFSRGDRQAARQELGFAPDDFVVGHVGRLAPEKNLEFLSRAVAAFLRKHSQARFLLVGKGKQEQTMEDCLTQAGVRDRLVHTGILEREKLRAAYHAMNVFAFSSKSETQGMVLTEAMAAGVPVVALRAPGVSDVVRDGVNGRMLDDEDEAAFTAALEWVAVQPPDVRQSLAEGARRTAREFSMPRCAARMLALYESLASELRRERAVQEDESVWSSAVRRVREELRIWSNVGTAVERAVLGFGTADLEEP